MRIAVISTYTHPTRLPKKERSFMQSAVPELIAGLCPPDAEIELYNEKEGDIPLDGGWDLVFFSYLHAYYEHTKVLSTIFRRRGITTVAGGRHAGHFAADAADHFDAVVVGDPEANVPALIQDFQRGELKPRYDLPAAPTTQIRAPRYDLIDFSRNAMRVPGIEASRGCPFSCNFCVLTGHERYRYRPVADVVKEIETKMRFNRSRFGLVDDVFSFLDNNLGGSPRYLRALCEALLPLKKTWGCALTWNILEDEELVKLMARAGCRYIYTGLESLNPDSIEAMNKGQNKLAGVREVLRRTYSHGILLSFGLLVGSDGDTNAYLERVPEYLAELKYGSVTFLGIVCPYPETPFFTQVAAEGRLLPNTTIRDYDGYTLCHRPKNLHPSEVVEHFQRLCGEIGSLRSAVRHVAGKLLLSDAPRYKAGILASAPEVLSIRAPLGNPARRYVAGLDPIEAWDERMMRALGLAPQRITPDSALATAKGLTRIRKRERAGSAAAARSVA
ncbi:B12-binding domain-containing radical SAM protein [Sorangium sp. So ce131]|uniref:B12-binding domain-containing radical SAM protein n=1 Tax=Sorangium sp. So ce131 TaxID=3133282 RepID=UPI003F5D9591